MRFCLFKLLYKACDFGCEIILLLLNALALFKASKACYCKLCADGFSDFSNVLLDGDLVALDIGLLEQAVFLVEFAYGP